MGSADDQLSTDFYNSTCSKALSTIKAVELIQQEKLGVIYNETNIDSSLATSLKTNCSSSTDDDDKLSSLDNTSHVIFDNGYYKNLVEKKGLLHSDQQLFSGGSTDSLVTTYSEDADQFYNDFANAMIKMGQLSPLTGTNGQIRTNCRKPN
ncbi:hypothetical protein G4B88_015153 [Cannabis sativa]|uniref:peroxidase n=1 Tax=Cannabis sativa TaxID=3483 RepID=A0A7J6FY45_CANSA|nr:hypothetical protein G4B88_015153 [Cannabis sativa]